MKTICDRKKVDGYYVGLDLGTSSVGWAVTDKEYSLVRYNNKDMWGSRLFDEAETAATRRVFRAARRRNKRKRQRIALLQELFAEEIAKVDSEFFLRLKESKFHPEDKRVEGKYNLFNEQEFTDKDYFDQYPTIYHLRKALIYGDTKPDLRLVYLALHHIIKNRGHFLMEGQDLHNVKDFTNVYLRFSGYLADNMEIEIPIEVQHMMEEILTDSSLTINDKKKKLNTAFDTNDKQLKTILAAIAGGKVQLKDLYANEEYADAEKTSIDFTKVAYEDEREEYEAVLQEDIQLLDIIKSVYDWTVLTEILGAHNYLSDALTETYEQHGKDLADIKYFLKNYGTDEDYFNALVSEKVKNNYTSYIGTTSYRGKKYIHHNGKTTQEDVNKFFEKQVEDYQVEEKDRTRYENLTFRLKERIALPKLRSKNNSVIPYQVHKMELEAILENVARYYPFLNEADETGYKVRDKIVKIMTFRIPYYVGPLNAYHGEENGGTGNAWIIKKTDEKILPWNFDKVVDKAASAERFIRRMTNKCSYLIGADVIPDDSLLYSKYKVLNEINNLRINGEPISIELKQKIFEQLFKTNKNVTMRKFITFLKKQGMEDADQAVITGVDNKFNSSYRTYVEFHQIFGDKINNEPWISIVEDIIRWKCLYGEDNSIFRAKVKEVHGDQLSEDELRKSVRKNFTGWARFSEEFLTEIPGASRETGEIFESIIDALWQTNDNLMELLSSKYTFAEGIEEWNKTDEVISRITYDKILKEAYISPAVKRTVWQTITILEEIRKIMGKVPERIFLEMTRAPETKKERKESRKKQLLDLYKACGQDVAYLKDSLEKHEDSDLRQKKLYLYYTQMGRCMYTGRIIDLDELLTDRNNIYDIDHIYPRSLTKDDSIDNTVLVTRKVNLGKSDSYPLSKEIRNKQRFFWIQLREKKFISDRKFSRLIRNTKLTTEELAGFISRQIVETSQSVKAVADILKKIYPDTLLVYTKARNVSDFRHKFELLKVRELNDTHHANDAFLNIVVGNTYYTQFTSNPFNFIKKKQQEEEKNPYNLAKVFDRKIERHGEEAWDPDKMLPKVKEIMSRKTVNITIMPYEQRGKLFNATLYPKEPILAKAKTMVPLKGSESRLKDLSKYGGYDSLTGAYFIVVEHTEKKRRIRTFETVYLMYANNIKNNKDLTQYCIEQLGLIDPQIICPKVKMKSKIYYDDYPFILKSRSSGGKSLRCVDAQAIYLNTKSYKVFREVSTIAQKTKDSKNTFLPKYLPSDDELRELYNEFVFALSGGPFSQRKGNPQKSLKEGKDKFEDLAIVEKIKVLSEIAKIFSLSSNNGVNLKSIGGAGRAAIIEISNKITGHDVILVHESPTGLHVKKTVLSKK